MESENNGKEENQGNGMERKRGGGKIEWTRVWKIEDIRGVI